MAWNVGIEDIEISDTCIEGQWEVDAGSEDEAKNPDLIPYLLVGVVGTDEPYPQPDWYSAQEIRLMEKGTRFYTGRILEDSDDWTEYETVQADPNEVAHIMDRISEGVSLSDFTLDKPA